MWRVRQNKSEITRFIVYTQWALHIPLILKRDWNLALLQPCHGKTYIKYGNMGKYCVHRSGTSRLKVIGLRGSVRLQIAALLTCLKWDKVVWRTLKYYSAYSFDHTLSTTVLVTQHRCVKSLIQVDSDANSESSWNKKKRKVIIVCLLSPIMWKGLYCYHVLRLHVLSFCVRAC